jgi:hypothetical protein
MYKNDTILYQICYKNKKIKSIIKPLIIKRPNNVNHYGTIHFNDVIFFDKKGRIKYIRYLTQDGMIEERYY